MTETQNNLEALRQIFTEETKFCADFTSLLYKLFTSDYKTLQQTLDGFNRHEEEDYSIFDFNYLSTAGTIKKTPDGRGILCDEIWFYKPDLTEPCLIIRLNSAGRLDNFTYDPDGIQW